MGNKKQEKIVIYCDKHLKEEIAKYGGSYSESLFGHIAIEEKIQRLKKEREQV